MTDPMTVIDPAHDREQEGVWTARLVLYLRIVAALSLIKGLYHWTGIAGIGDEPGAGFEANPLPWQAATVFFAVIDLVAAVGLWLAAAWGGVVWLTAAISMAGIELFFPQIFGGRYWVIPAELVLIIAYACCALMAARERPE
jgi:Family of unknown function (DUF6163)